jgi:hypothetical protein
MVQTPRQEGRTTMGEDRFEQLMRQHGMKRTHAGLATIRFEKKDLSIETGDSGETFIVRSGCKSIHVQTSATLLNTWKPFRKFVNAKHLPA